MKCSKAQMLSLLFWNWEQFWNGNLRNTFMELKHAFNFALDISKLSSVTQGRKCERRKFSCWTFWSIQLGIFNPPFLPESHQLSPPNAIGKCFVEIQSDGFPFPTLCPAAWDSVVFQAAFSCLIALPLSLQPSLILASLDLHLTGNSFACFVSLTRFTCCNKDQNPQRFWSFVNWLPSGNPRSVSDVQRETAVCAQPFWSVFVRLIVAL